MRQQIEEIRKLNQQLDGIRILAGAEVDIRADGSLDMSPELLAELDIVVAAIHSGMNETEEKLTRRVVGAIENTNVDVIAHPTCRLLGEREPVAIDMEAVFKAAVKHNKALEINASPYRLDLKDTHIRRAIVLGVTLVMGTDAHSIPHLGFMRFGIGIARRGWCQANNVLNTKSLEDVLASFKN